jgi:RelB Antitoxin alpha helical domain
MKMLELHKSYVIDDNQRPIAVQIPIAEFEKIEEILENYGLAKLMEEVEEEKPLSKYEALKYYQSIKEENVAS